jgi:thioredoxin-related protein
MKAYPILFVFFFSFFVPFATSQSGINFEDKKWQEILNLAQREHKIIFMDAYAEWCGPCKKMAKDVFTQKEVGDFFNKHFINVKIDMEKGEGPNLSNKYKVTAYPSLFFIDETGEIIHVQVGAVQSEQLLALGKMSLGKNDKSKSFEEAYENGDRSPELLRSFAYSLMVSGQPFLKIANEYLKSQKDVNNESVLEFIYDFTVESDGSIYDKLIQNMSAIKALKGDSLLRMKVRKACDATVDKAVEFESPELLSTAKNNMKKAFPDQFMSYSLLADFRYFYKKRLADPAFSAAEKYLSKFGKTDPHQYYVLGLPLLQLTSNPDILKKIESWAEKAFQLKPSAKHCFFYQDLLMKNNKSKEAQLQGEKCKTMQD